MPDSCEHKNIMSKILLSVTIICLFIILLLGTMVFHKQEKATIISSSYLKEAVNIAELSTAQFTYNGVAEVLNEKKNDILCHVRYEAKVKAGIDMNDMDFTIDEEQKIITPVLPEIKIKANIVDEKTLSFIPENANIDLKQAIKTCRADVETEASNSEKFFRIAKENMQSIIEGLLYPITAPYGYTIAWN